MRFIKSFIFLSCSILVVNSCKNRTFNKVKGLDLDNSNVETKNLVDVSQLRTPSSLHIPKGVIVSFISNNSKLIADLYQHIYHINKSEKLSGNEGRNQEITLVIALSNSKLTGSQESENYIKYAKLGTVGEPIRSDAPPKNPKALPGMGDESVKFSQLKQQMAEAVGHSQPENLPYVKYLGIEESNALWMKDWGEFFIGKDPSGKGIYGIVTTNHRLFRTFVPQLAKVFKVPLIEPTGLAADYVSGNSAGNIMGTHNERIIVGDAMTPAFQESLQKQSKYPLIRIPTKWLSVGHVDEYMSIIPSRLKCKAALLHASPVKGFEVILNETFDEKDSIFATVERNEIRISELRSAIRKFLKNPLKTKNLTIDDFYLSKEVYSSGLNAIEKFVQRNLWTEREKILVGIRTILNEMGNAPNVVANAACFDEVIGLPQFFGNPHQDIEWEKLESLQVLASFPDVVNMVALRNYLILPNPWTLQFQKSVVLSLSRVADPSKIFFADTRFYSKLEGEIHCGTNVVRDPLFKIYE